MGGSAAEPRQATARYPLLATVTRLIDPLVNGCLLISCVTALFVALYGTADVVSTYFFKYPLPVASELPAELLVVIIFMALPRVMRDDRNVAIDLVMEHASPSAQRVARILSLCLCAAIFAFLSWRSFHSAMASYAIREAASALYRFPIWPIKILMVAALVVTCLESLRLAVSALLDQEEPKINADEQPVNMGF